MIAKVLMVTLSASLCVAAPGIIDVGHGSPGLSYATLAASPIQTQVVHSAPLIQKTIVAQPQIISAPQWGAAPWAAAPQWGHGPIIQKQIIAEPEVIDPNPQYSFAYGVSDPHTGDSKNAQETLVNGVVHGSYSLVEPDGHVRKVTYTSDKVNGFNAVVERTGGAPVAKIAVAAPAIALGHGHPW